MGFKPGLPPGRGKERAGKGTGGAGAANAKPKLEPMKLPGKFPDMPWKKK